MDEDNLTPLQQAIEARSKSRKTMEFDMPGIVVDDAGTMPGKVRVRTAFAKEETSAVVEATRWLNEGGRAIAAKDGDISQTAKIVFFLHKVLRDHASPDNFPAFPTPDWMLEKLTKDELVFLHSIYLRHSMSESPLESDTSDETFEAYQVKLSQLRGSLTGQALVHCDRVWLEEFAAWLAVRLSAAEQALEEHVQGRPLEADPESP